jgi:hypothetical protein
MTTLESSVSDTTIWSVAYIVIYYAPRVINYALREHYSTAITNDDRNKFIVQTSEVATFLFS